MDLLLGGAYQGKLEHARKAFAVSDEDVCTCAWDAEPDWSKRCLEHLERYVMYCVKNGLTPERKYRPDAVLLCDDIFCGIVPMDPVDRAWREETGRYLSRLSADAESVTRLFCSLPMKLK